ncbi:protein [Arthrobacter sp. Hiyo4]|nr:protein [Arthrobacter sp. Hiyo4]
MSSESVPGLAQPKGRRSGSTTSCQSVTAAGSPANRPALITSVGTGWMVTASDVVNPRWRKPRSRPTKDATKSLAGARRISSGVAYWASRPPTAKTATLSPRIVASSISWVTKTMVFARSFCSLRSSCCSSSRTTGSTALNGSSISRTGGSAASARATPTRCCWPPESWEGYLFPSAEASPTTSSSSVARLRASALETPLSRGTVAMLSSTERCGISPEDCMT